MSAMTARCGEEHQVLVKEAVVRQNSPQGACIAKEAKMPGIRIQKSLCNLRVICQTSFPFNHLMIQNHYMIDFRIMSS